MNLLKRVFGSPRSETASAGASSALQPFIDELTAIGNAEGFLALKPGGRYDDQRRHVRATEIGRQIYALGGKTLMRTVYERVDCPNQTLLAAMWDGIGDWTSSSSAGR